MPVLYVGYFLLILAAAWGWIANIYKLAAYSPALIEWSATEVLRVVGIFFAPLGSILGFL